MPCSCLACMCRVDELGGRRFRLILLSATMNATKMLDASLT